MMKRLFLIVCLLSMIGSGFAQIPKTFDKFFSYPNVTDGKFLFEHPEGGFALVGGTRDNNTDFYVMKVDSLGQYEWHSQFGSQVRPDFVQGATLSSDDHFLLTGETTLNGIYEIYLVKTDLEGKMIWQKTYGHQGDAGRDILPLSDGYYLLAYDFHSALSTQTDGDFLLIKLNQEGDSLWAKSYGDGTNWTPKKMKVIHDKILIFGEIWVYDTLGSSQGFNTILATNLDGDSLWTQKMPVTTGGRADDLWVYDDKLLVISKHATFLIDTSGQVLWIRPGSGNRFHLCGAKLDEQSYVVGETFNNNYETILCWRTLAGDSFRTDTIEDFRVSRILSFPDRSLLLVGNSKRFGGLGNLRLIRTDCEGNVLNPVRCPTVGLDAVADIGFQLFPNPVSDKLYITLPPDAKQAEIRFFEISGRALNGYVLHQGENRLNVAALPEGILIYELKVEGKSSWGKVVKGL